MKKIILVGLSLLALLLSKSQCSRSEENYYGVWCKSRYESTRR